MTAPTEPLTVPTSDDVAALLRARTKDLDGKELGVFTANTRPTDAEVDALISQVYDVVTAESGLYLADPCAGLARQTIAIGAAAYIELSYFPEQVRSDRSVYRELTDQFTAARERLTACVLGNTPGSAGGAEGTGGYRFGTLDVHGWTSVREPFGVPADPETVALDPYGRALPADYVPPQ